MAEGEVRIKELEEVTTLTQNHYFIVDSSASGVKTEKYSAADYLANESELVDIRTGADGVTYNSAGDAVREQFDKIPHLISEWVALKTYYPNDYVSYQGKLYYMNSDYQIVSTTFSTITWTETTLDKYIKDFNLSVAENYATDNTYKIGDFALKNSKLYQCIEETTGNWSSSKWNQISLAEFISDEVIPMIYNAYPTGEASGTIATFHDGSNLPLKSLTADITAIQDLHGYDSPWAGGAGKNKFDYSQLTNASGWTNTGGTYSGNIYNLYAYAGNGFPTQPTYKANTAYTFSMKVVDTDGTSRFVIEYTDSTSDYVVISSVSIGNYVKVTSNPSKTISKIYFTYNNSGNLSIREIMLEEGTSRTAWTPYSNICPISGWTEEVITRTGVNVWDEEWEVGAIGYANGQNLAITDRIRSKNYIPILPNTSYYYIFPNGGAYFFYDENKTFISATQTQTSKSVESPSNACFTRFIQYPEYGTTYNNDISINYPSTDTSYHAYNGNTYSLTFTDGTNPLTVYGGKVDLVSGVLTVDKAMVTLNGSENYYSIQSSSADDNTVLRTVTGQACKQNENQKSNYGTFDNFAWQRLESKANTFVLGSEGNLYLQLPSSTASTVAEFKALFASNPLQVVYELATPLTYSLTKQQIRSLVGENNIFADTGAIRNVTYRRDNNTIINGLLNNIQFVTQAQYDALPSSKTSNGVLYFITG